MPDAIRVGLGLDVDEASIRKGVGAIDQLDAGVGALAKDVSTIDLSAINQATGTLTKAVSSETLDYKALAAAAEAAQRQSEALARSQAAQVIQTTQLAAETQTLAKTAVLAADTMAVGATQTTEALQTQAVEVQDLTDLYQALDEQAQQASSATHNVGAMGGPTAASSSDSGISAQQLGSRAAGIGSILGSAAGGGALRDIGQFIQLGATLGPFGVAAGLAAVALKSATEAEQKRTEAAKAYIDAVSASAGETSADIQKQIDTEKARQASIKEAIDTDTAYGKAIDENRAKQDQLAKDIAAAQANGTYGGSFDTLTPEQAATRQELKQRGDDLNTTFIALNAQIYDTTKGALGFKDGLGAFVGSSDEFAGVLKTGRDQLKTSTDNLGFLNTQMGTAAVAAADAAAAQKALSDALVAGVEQSIQSDHLTKAQRDEKIASDQRDIETLNALINSSGLTADAEQQLKDKRDALTQEVTSLTNVTTSYADTLKAEEDAKASLKSQTDAYFDALQNEGKARDELTPGDEIPDRVRAANRCAAPANPHGRHR